MGLLSFPRFGLYFGAKLVVVWLVVGVIYGEVYDQGLAETFTTPPDWAWVTLLSTTICWANYNWG